MKLKLTENEKDFFYQKFENKEDKIELMKLLQISTREMLAILKRRKVYEILNNLEKKQKNTKRK